MAYMKKELGLLTLLTLPFISSADWLDVNMPVGVTDISEEVLAYNAYVLDNGSHWCCCIWCSILRNVEVPKIK